MSTSCQSSLFMHIYWNVLFMIIFGLCFFGNISRQHFWSIRYVVQTNHNIHHQRNTVDMHKKWRLTTRCHLFSACWPDLHSCDWICVSVECVSVVVLSHRITKLVEFPKFEFQNLKKRRKFFTMLVRANGLWINVDESQWVFTFSFNFQTQATQNLCPVISLA